MARVDAARTRRSFSRLENALDVPNLIDIQRRSFEWLVDTEKGGLRETIDDVSPIEDYTGNLAVVFEEIHFDEPVASISECREKDITYARPLTVKVAFQNRETGEIREQSVFMGDFPWMTDWGTFIINGTERVVVTQLVRSPGAYVMEPKDREKQVFIANLMPARGSWLELEIDKKGRVYVRIDRKRKLPVSVLLRAMGDTLREGGYVPETWTGTDEEILGLFDESLYIRLTLESDTEVTKSEDGSLIELFKKQRPGEPPSIDAAKNLLNQLFFDPKRYDLTRVGRYKLNSRLHVDEALDTRTLTPRDIIELIKELISLPKILGIPESGMFDEGNGEEPIKDFALEAHLDAARADRRSPRRVRALRQPPSAHRRRADPGGLPDRPLPHGARRARAPHHRGLGHDHAADDHQHPPGRGGPEGVLRVLASCRSSWTRRTRSTGLTHRRRLSALGAGGLTRERAPIEVRDVHPTHYGRMCPIETPEGPNIGLIGSLSSFAQVSEFGFVTTPYRVVKDGVVTDEIVHLDATQEEHYVIAQANAEIDFKNGKLKGPQVECRAREGELVLAAPKDVDLMDVSPNQIWSVATGLIPFLEHDDANRALMGSNMQRQAVPLLKTDAPFVGHRHGDPRGRRHRRRAGRAQRRHRRLRRRRADRDRHRRDQGRVRPRTSSCAPTRAR